MTDSSNDWQEVLRSHLQKSTRPLITILGQTASGKTAFSIEVAKWISGERVGEWEGAEVVNADSRQLYKEMDIGTAKITSDEMQGIPHHILDLLDPKEDLTVAWYKERAEKVIDEILKRKHVPLLVGGSMLYISSIIDSLEFIDPAPSETRERLSTEYDLDQGESLFKTLEEIDPETARSIDRRNKPYVLRALEIYETQGAPASTLKREGESPFDLLIFGIDRSREDIHERIETRTKKLLESGWITEVEDLLAKGYTKDDPGMRSHGYREIISFLQDGTMSELELEEKINAKTRQYAKRQRTWWRGDERTKWIGL